MAENLTSAQCSIAEYEAARAAGLLVVTTADERAIHAFATALLAEKAQRIERLEAALAAAELALFHGANMLNAICETEETVDRRRAAEKLVDATKAARVAILEETTGEKP